MAEVVKRRRNRPKGSGTKYGVPMPEALQVRLTATSKAQALTVAEQSGAGTASDFWRAVVEGVSQGVLDLNEGQLSAAEFKARYGELVYNFLVKPVH